MPATYLLLAKSKQQGRSLFSISLCDTVHKLNTLTLTLILTNVLLQSVPHYA